MLMSDVYYSLSDHLSWPARRLYSLAAAAEEADRERARRDPGARHPNGLAMASTRTRVFRTAERLAALPNDLARALLLGERDGRIGSALRAAWHSWSTP